MKKIFCFVSITVLVLCLYSCSKAEFPTTSICEEAVRIDPHLYANAQSQVVYINNLEITGNCLKVNFSSSGCSGINWDIQLVDAGMVMESYPPQRKLRLILKNRELCQAIISSEASFDISNLKVGNDKVFLNFSHNGEQILFNY